MVFIQQLRDSITQDAEWHAWADIVATHTIDEDVKFGCDHGIRHWEKVADIAKDFVLRASGDERNANLAEIAGLLHDCGLICGNDHHAENGAQIAKAFLKAHYGNRQPLSDIDIDVICHAIANHSNGTEIINIVDAAIFFADKIDVSRDRVNTTSSIILAEAIKIKSVDYEITNDRLILRYQVEDGFDHNQFFRWRKALEGPAKAATFIGKDFAFYLNDQRYSLPAANTTP